MINSQIETLPDFDLITKEKPKPPTPAKKPMSFMRGVYKVQIFFKWFLCWRDFKTRMMQSNGDMIHTHKVKVQSKEHGHRLYNIQVWKICTKHHDDPINNYRMIKNYNEIRRKNMEYTLLGYEVKASHQFFNKSKNPKLHKSALMQDQKYEVNHTYHNSPSEVISYNKNIKNPYHEKLYKLLEIPYNLME
jgi:hypothetical protein